MNYKNKSDQSDKKVLNSLIATKIRDLMEKLRLDASEIDKRRWIWELLQNAKDVAYPGEMIQAEVELTETAECSTLTFKHNGKPFCVDDITFLIKQASSKERELPRNDKTKPTGKFGTGFLTTHLLSEKVKVSGIVKEPGLEYRSFVLPLDRSGRNSEEIIASVNKSIAIRDALDEYDPLIDFKQNNFNTTFEFNLNEEGINVAKKGIEDLQISLPFTLVFVSTINSVRVLSHNMAFELDSVNELNPNIRLYKIKKTVSGEYSFINIVELENQNISIAIEVEINEENYSIKAFSKDLPRVFCDFPLIGTNDFALPFIINSSRFNPTEPRDGVWLTDKLEPKIIENKQIFSVGIDLYSQLLEFAAKNQWENLVHLAAIKMPTEKKWFSKSWFEEHIQKNIRTKLLTYPIVTLEDGNLANILDEEGNPNIYFPYHSKEEVRDRIWNLRFKFFPNKVPAKENIHYWYDLVWNDCFKDTPKAITEFIQEKKTLSTLTELMEEEHPKIIEWLNEYFDFLNLEGKFIEEIIANKFAVIPNQIGEFKKKREVSIDQGIEEELKNTLEILGVKIRENLRHKDIRTASKYKEADNTEGQITYSVKSQEEVINNINQILETGENPNSDQAVYYLLCLFNNEDSFPERRETLFRFCQDLIPADNFSKKKIETWSDNIWKIADKKIIDKLVMVISETKDLLNLSKHLKKELYEDTIDWLNSFITFLNDNGFSEKLNLEASPILPNQKGIFCIKDDLFLDNGDIDEKLKVILEKLGSPIRSELLDKNISLSLPQSRERNEEFVAEEIKRLITPLFSEFPRSEETRQLFKSIYLWFNENKEKASILFQSLYDNKHKLYDDDEIAENLKKAKLLDEISKKTGFTPDQIREKLETLILNEKISQKNHLNNGKPISDQTGLYPIGSEEDILISPSLFDGSSKRSRISINEEAKETILKTLKNQGFEISDNFQIKYTIAEGIISPTGKPIKIVIKGGKAGKIYFNPNEWLALTKPDSQLFVVTKNNVVRNITLSDLESVNDTFHMRFNTLAFSMTNVKAFADFFQYQPFTHFIFESPESTSDYLEQFGLNERNPSFSELSADDINLLH